MPTGVRRFYCAQQAMEPDLIGVSDKLLSTPLTALASQYDFENLAHGNLGIGTGIINWYQSVLLINLFNSVQDAGPGPDQVVIRSKRASGKNSTLPNILVRQLYPEGVLREFDIQILQRDRACYSPRDMIGLRRV